MDVLHAAHPLAPIINAAFDRNLSYAELAQMLSPAPAPKKSSLEPEGGQLWSDLEFLYELGIEQAADAETGRRLMVELARICLEQLGDAEAAEHHLRRALATDPAHSDGLDLYVRMLIAGERFDEAIEALELAIEAAADDDKTDLLVELASVAYLHLDQTDRAIAALFAAHEHNPSRIDVMARARVILVEQARWLEVKRALDEETSHVLARGGEEDDAALHSLAESYRLLGERVCSLRPKLAEECFRRASLLGDGEASEKHERIMALESIWADEAERCREEGFAMPDRATAAMLHLRAAGFALDYGKDHQAAEASVDRSWLLDASWEAVEMIESLYTAQDRVRDLPSKLLWMAERTKERETKIEVLLRAARIAETYSEGLSWYRRVLDVAPTNEEALERVDRILVRHARHDVRAAMLEARLEHASGRAARRIGIALGRIYTEHLGDYERAIQHLTGVLAQDPSSFEAASLLRVIYRDTGEPEKLAGVVDVLIEYSPDRKSRNDLLAEQGVRGRRFRKCRRERSLQKRSQAGTSCMPSGRGDNLASDGGERRAAEERPVS